MTLDLPGALGLFILAAVVVVLAATKLVVAGDVIASRTGWGQVWVGSLLVAAATSLPELVTEVSAVRIGAPALAAGTTLGSNMLNMGILALAVALLGERGFYEKLQPQQSSVAAFAITMTGLATLLAALRPQANWLGVTPAAVTIIVAYLVGSRVLFRFATSVPDPQAAVASRSLRWGWVVFGLSAGAIFAAAPFLALSAQRLAQLTGLEESFIGVLAVAFVTSLPELVTTITAVRMGARDLAVSGIHGSNAVNVAILAVADLFYTEGSLFGALDRIHVTAGLFAVLLVGLGLVQILLRRPLKRLSIIEPGSLATISLYSLGAFLLFRMR